MADGESRFVSAGMKGVDIVKGAGGGKPVLAGRSEKMIFPPCHVCGNPFEDAKFHTQDGEPVYYWKNTPPNDAGKFLIFCNAECSTKWWLSRTYGG